MLASDDIEKVKAMLQGIAAGDADRAIRHINPARYVEHDPRRADGVDGLKRYIRELCAEDHRLTVVRAIQDGDHVVTQADGLILGRGVFFEIFRFEDGSVVEHWAFSTKSAPPNKSGHTQTDGPARARNLEDTEKNKSIIRDYYETVHVRGEHGRIPQYFSGDRCVRHEPGVSDGVGNFRRDLEQLVKHRSIDGIKFLFGQGDFVFIAATGTVEGAPCTYLDLYRVQDEKIAERWGFPEPVPPQALRKNDNGML